MKIENLRLDHRKATPKGFKTLCTFSLELTEDAKIYDLQLVKGPDGDDFLAVPKSPNGSPMCSLSPGLRKVVMDLAKEELTRAFGANMGSWFHKNFSQ